MWGRKIIGTSSGIRLRVTADGKPEWKLGGATIDWSKPVAVGSAFTIQGESLTVPAGAKYLRYGQVMTRISNPTVQTLAITGATAGTFTVTGTNPFTQAQNTATLNWNDSIANVQAGMDSIFGAGNALVSGAGALPANTLTVTFQGLLQYLTIPALVLNTANLTGGTPAVVVTNAGANTGWYGPYDNNATDGRQTLTNGQVGILDQTILQTGPLGFTIRDTDHVGLIVGGYVFTDRLLATTGSASLAAGPTLAALLTAMPNLQLVGN